MYVQVCVCEQKMLFALTQASSASTHHLKGGGTSPVLFAQQLSAQGTEAAALLMNLVIVAAAPNLPRHLMAYLPNCLPLHSPSVAEETRSSFRFPSFPAFGLHSDRDRHSASVMNFHTSLALIVPSPTLNSAWHPDLGTFPAPLKAVKLLKA